MKKITNKLRNAELMDLIGVKDSSRALPLNIQHFATNDSKFDAKSFNPAAFGSYVSRIPSTKRNELIKSRALTGNQEIRDAFSSQTTTAYARLPFYGTLDGEALNYDGQTDITATSTVTYERGVVVVGRSKAWTEKDFSTDITGGVNFMDNVAAQTAEYWDSIDQDTLLSVLKGIFSMTGEANLKFVNGHTNDITAAGDGVVGPATLNTTLQKSCGDNKSAFSLVIMHSAVATNLENMKLLKYLTYTDADGIQRDLTIGTWNGRTVIVDDSMPTEEVAATYVLTKDTEIDASKTYYIKSGSSYTAVQSPSKDNIATYYEQTDVAHIRYTTYALGNGAIDYEDIGAKVPYEMARDPKTNGGQDTLYTRQRKVFAPYGISYEKKSQATLSPTNAELEKGANWALVSDGSSKYIDHKAIPIARIISRG